MEGYQQEGGGGSIGEKVQGLRSTDLQVQNRQGEVKHSIGNGVAKKLIHMTHGHEQWCGDCLRQWGGAGAGQREAKGGNIGKP